MSAPAQQDYGYAHRGTVRRASEQDGYWFVRCTAINPLGEIGPYASTVPDLVVDDRVLLTQIGQSRDDLVITGKLPAVPWDANLPIDITDVTGLPAALADRATDAELAAAVATLNSANTTQDGRLTAVEGVNTTQNGRLTAVEGLNTTQDGRLTAAEGRLTTDEAAIAANGVSIAANGVSIAANAAALNLLNTWAWRYQDHDFDVYGDLVGFGDPRSVFDTTRTVGGSFGLICRTRVRRDVNVSTIRLYTTTAGVGASGLTLGAIYTSASALTTYTLINSGTAALTGATGRRNITVASTALTAGTYVLVLLIHNGYTTAPIIAGSGVAAHNTLLNPAGGIVWGGKTPISAAPATIDPQDGSWTAQAAPWWVALS